MYNRLLSRQIRKYLPAESIPPGLRPLLQAVSASYDHFELDRDLIERSMDLSSQELMAANERLRRESSRQQVVIESLKQTVATLDLQEGHDYISSVRDDELVNLAAMLRQLVDKRRLAEQQLLESEERFRLIAENSSDLIVKYDSHGKSVYISPSSFHLLGYQPHELIGKTVFDVMHPGDTTRIAALLTRAVKKGTEAPFTLTARVQRHDGQYRWFETTVRIMRTGARRRVKEFHTAARDVTQRKQVETEVSKLNEELHEANAMLRVERDREKELVHALRQLNEMKNEFVSSVSHELRTPLASIIGFAQTVLADDDMDGIVRREFIGIIQSEGKRLSKLINELLDVARIESGRLEIDRHQTPVIPLLERAMQSVSISAQAKHIGLIADFAQPDIVAPIDADRISQVVINLLDNAIKFTPENGQVILHACHNSHDTLVLSVKDTGMGIPPDSLPHVFDKFYRVRHPGTEVRGTGLGLAIVRQLVEMHGGTIAVESSETGSTFTVRLPVN